MPTYIRKNTDPNKWEMQKSDYDKFLSSIVDLGETVGEQDQKEKEFFLKLAEKGIELDPEAQSYLSGFSKYFKGLGDWKKKDQGQEQATQEQAPEEKKAPETARGKIFQEQAPAPQAKQKIDLQKLGAILDSGDFSQLKEQFPEQFGAMDKAQQDEFIRSLSPGDELPAKAPAPAPEIPPIPSMGELRAYEAGRITGPEYENFPNMETLTIEGSKQEEIPALLPKQAPIAQDEGDQYGTGYLGSLARYSKRVRDTGAATLLTNRLNALKNSYANAKDEATRKKIEAETALLLQKKEDEAKPWAQSREGQKAQFDRETKWQTPKDISLQALYEQRVKNLKEGKGENPLEKEKFEFQKDKEARAISNDLNRVTEPLRNIDFELSKMSELVRLAKERARAGVDQVPADDYAIIFSFLKMLDQRSIVRETEYETAQKLQNLKNTIPGIFEKLDSGGTLTDDQRDAFLNTSRVYAKEGYAANKSALDNYRSLINKNKLSVTVPAFPKLDALIQKAEGNNEVINAAKRILNDPKSSNELRRKARQALEKTLR